MKTRLGALEAKRDAVASQMQAIHTAAGDEPLSAEQLKSWNDLKGQHDTLVASVEAAKAQDAIDRAAAPVKTTAGDGGAAKVTVTDGHDREVDKPWAGAGGFGGFLKAVRTAEVGGGVDPRLHAAATGMGEAIGPDGGYAVPIEYAPGIEKNMWEQGKILSRVSDRPVSGNSMSFNVINETSRADGSRRGGILGYWLDEGAAPTASSLKLAKADLKLKKVGALGYMSDEVNEDAPTLEAELLGGFTEELIFQAEDSIVNGNGTSRPQGFLVAPCLVSVTKLTNQPAATIKMRNLSDMWVRMPTRSKANSVWLVNGEVSPELDELSIPAGTAALEPRFVNYGPDGILRIKGREVVEVEYCAALGTIGDICLVDLGQYRVIRKNSGVQTASSIHVRFLQNENTYRAVYRIDGQALPRAAITPYKGSATLSPFVALATRA